MKPGEQLVEIGDNTAQLVLGGGNMDEWNHARFMSTMNIIYWLVVLQFSGLYEFFMTFAFYTKV